MKYEDELKRLSEQMGPGASNNIPPMLQNPQKTISKIVISFIVFSVLLTAGIGALIYFLMGGISEFISEEVEHTAPLSGDIQAFDPVNRFAEIQAFAGVNTVLTEIDATFVKSDGTIDLMATYQPSPHATYSFYQVLDTPPPDTPPTGATQWYQKITVEAHQPGQKRHVTQRGNVNLEYYYTTEGLQKNYGSPSSNKPSSEPIDPPACHFSQLWAVAIEQGASPNLVADIEYNEDGYEFSIRDADIDLEFDVNCRLIED